MKGNNINLQSAMKCAPGQNFAVILENMPNYEIISGLLVARSYNRMFVCVASIVRGDGGLVSLFVIS